MIITG